MFTQNKTVQLLCRKIKKNYKVFENNSLKNKNVSTIRFELTRLTTPPPQDGESTNSSTWT